MSEERRIVTPEFRLSFPSLVQKDKFGNYAITMIFDPNTDFSLMKELAAEAKAKKWGDKPPSYVRSPFRQGVQKSEQHPNGFDLTKRPEYRDMVIVTATSKMQPGMRDADAQPVIEVDKLFYAGCYCRASVTAYAHHYQDPETKAWGNPGISFGLQAIQFCRPGERFGGGDPEGAASEFTAVNPAKAGNHADLLGLDV